MDHRYLVVGICALATAIYGQPAQQRPDPDVPMAVFKVDVVAKTAKAINYRHRNGATKVDYKGTANLPAAKGDAKDESKQG